MINTTYLKRLLLITFFIELLLITKFTWEIYNLDYIPNMFENLPEVCGLGIYEEVIVYDFDESQIIKLFLTILYTYMQGEIEDLRETLLTAAFVTVIIMDVLKILLKWYMLDLLFPDDIQAP